MTENRFAMVSQWMRYGNINKYLEAHPEKRVTVVIDNFLHKSQDGLDIYNKIAEWSAALVTSNVAHVIFLTHDVSFSKSLSKALPVARSG